MFLQQWVAEVVILMDHCRQHVSLTPFFTWFLYPWNVTLCLHFLMKSSRISHLQREKSGKDCGWWVIDELDQFIPWYIHILLHKRRWTSKMAIWYCFLCFDNFSEPLQLNVFEMYKEIAINKASLFLNTSDKSSQLAMSAKFLSWWKKALDSWWGLCIISLLKERKL